MRTKFKNYTAPKMASFVPSGGSEPFHGGLMCPLKKLSGLRAPPSLNGCRASQVTFWRGSTIPDIR